MSVGIKTIIMIRTQEEIKTRFEQSDDFMGIQKGDLIGYMTFENAKPYLKDDYVEKVEKGEETWQQKTTPKEEILDYLEFSYSKAHGKRGLSAGRSMLHLKTWIWLDDDDFYNKIIGLIDNYTSYGLPALDKIAEYYDWERWKKEKDLKE